MEKHLGPTGKVPFQDDITIASSDIKSHIQDVKEVLDILTYKLGLRLRMKKYKLQEQGLKWTQSKLNQSDRMAIGGPKYQKKTTILF